MTKKTKYRSTEYNAWSEDNICDILAKLEKMTPEQRKNAYVRVGYRDQNKPVTKADAIKIRVNKERLGLVAWAYRLHTTVEQVANAAYGVSHQGLNDMYLPWPTKEQLKANPRAWKERDVEQQKINNGKKPWQTYK